MEIVLATCWQLQKKEEGWSVSSYLTAKRVAVVGCVPHGIDLVEERRVSF